MSDQAPALVVAGGSNTVRLDGLRKATDPVTGPFIDSALATVTVKKLDTGATIIFGPTTVPAVGSGGDYAVDLPATVPFAAGEMYDVFVEGQQGASKFLYRERVKATDQPPPTP
jgi:hypothetical protein